MEVTFSPYDPTDYLTTEEDIAAYLEAALAEGDPDLLAAVLQDVARARTLWIRPKEARRNDAKA